MDNSDGSVWRQTRFIDGRKIVIEKPALIAQRPWGEIQPLYLQRCFDECRQEFCFRLFSILHIDPNQELSVQVHRLKLEQFNALYGRGVIRHGQSADSMVEEALPTIRENPEGIVIPPGVWHQLATGEEGVEVLEVATGYQILQADIRRTTDPFCRPNNDPGNPDHQLTDDDRRIYEFLGWEHDKSPS